MDYKVDFVRIGRNRNVKGLVVSGTETELLDAVLEHCNVYLASSEFDVTIDLDTGRGWIDGGRFGTFTVQEE